MQKICIINKSKDKTQNKLKGKKSNKGKFVIVMSFIMFVLGVIGKSNIYAVETSSNYGKYNIFSYSDSNRYIKYNSKPQRIHEYYYENKNGNKLPAYCMSLGLGGAETVEGGYNINANSLLSDKIVNNIILNGYPYKTVEELNLASESEARYATQFAIWIKLNNLDINGISPMDTQYQRVVDAIKTIYYNGLKFNSNYTNGIIVKEKRKDTVLDDKDSKYYSKSYDLEYGDNIVDIELKINGVNNYIITDENNNKLERIVGNKKIKVLFLRKDNVKNNNISLEFTSKFKQTAVLFGKSEVSGMQDVSLTLQPIEVSNIKLNFDFKNITTHLIIFKKDAKDNNINIPNVKFQIYDDKSNLLGEYLTDKDGKIDLELEKDLKIFCNQNLKVKEVQTPYPYVIDEKNNTKQIEVTIGKSSTITFTNQKIEQTTKTELPKTGF